MANRDMKLDILVRLKDGLTPGLDKITRSMQKIGAVGGMIAAISFAAPMQEAAAFQQQLLDIAKTSELTGDAAYQFADKYRREYEEMALRLKQTSHNIATGAQIMIAAGLSQSQIDGAIEGIEKATTAANAAEGDMALLGTSLIQNLKLPANEVADALGGMMTAGKAGSFEMADMAREFPQLTSGFANIGITGREAVNSLSAFLEVTRKGTATSAEAATNMRNLVAEIQSPRVVKNFAKMGVDIQAVMKDAVAKGINPLEAAIQKAGAVAGVSGEEIAKYMNEAKAHGMSGAAALAAVQEKLEKLGRAGGLAKLFGNQMSRDAVIAILANVEEYRDLKDKIAKSGKDTVQADFDTTIKSFAANLRQLGEIATQAGREVGYAFNEWLPQINAGLIYLLEKYRQIDEQTGGFLKKLLSFGAAATFAAVALGGLGLAIPLAVGGLEAIGAVIGALLSPIGLFIAALAAAAVLIYQNWDKAAPKLKAFWADIKDTSLKAWAGIQSAWGKLAPYMGQLWGRISRDAGRSWRALAPYAAAAWGSVKNSIARIFSGINWDKVGMGALKAYNAAMRALGNTWEWLGRVWDGAKPYMEGIGQSLSRAFGTVMSGVAPNIKSIAEGLLEMGKSIAYWLGFGNKDSGVPEFLGDILGFLGQLAALGLEAVAQSLQIATGAISALISLLNGNIPDWRRLFPEWLVDYIGWIGSGLLNVSQFMHKIFGDTEGMPGMQQATPDMIGEMQKQAQKGDELLKSLPPQQDKNFAEFSRRNSKFPGSVPAPAAVKVDNKAEMIVKVIGGNAQVSGRFNGEPIKAVSDGGLAVGRP